MDAPPRTLGFAPPTIRQSLEDDRGQVVAVTKVLRRANSRGTVVLQGIRGEDVVAIKLVSYEESGKAEAEVLEALKACAYVPTILATVSVNTSWYGSVGSCT